MKRYCIGLALLALVFAGCTPKEVPAILNACEHRFSFDARFADGHQKSGVLESNTTWWLSYDESPLVALTVSREGRQMLAISADTLREWQKDIGRREPLVIAVKESGAERLPLSVLDAEIQKRKKAAAVGAGDSK